MIDGKCSKGYPKRYSESTVNSFDGYPIFRRRQIFGEISSLLNTMCTKYNAHINVDICSSVKAVKYLYKYFYKRHDRMNVEVGVDGSLLGVC
jgi:hypothetical protein